MERCGALRLDCAPRNGPSVDSRKFIDDDAAQTFPAERRPTDVVGSRHNKPPETTGVELICRGPGRRGAIFAAVASFFGPAPMRMVLCVCVAAIAALSLVPGHFRPHSFLPGQAEHFVVYAGTGLFVALGYTTPRQRFFGWLGLALASGAFELLENIVRDRPPSTFDALASTAGLSVGLATGALAVAWRNDGRRSEVWQKGHTREKN